MIVVIVRTHNEERNLNKFILAYYDWVDRILVYDDSSDDVEYLINAREQYKDKVRLQFYDNELPRIEGDGVSRAEHYVQLNYMIAWAESLGATWIIHDDCDCVPVKELQELGREFLDLCHTDFMFVTRYYLYKDQGYAPGMSPDASLWAWKTSTGFRFKEVPGNPQTFDPLPNYRVWNFHNTAYALLHRPWPDEETIQRKMDFYKRLYGHVAIHPADYIGDIVPLESWMVD